MDNRNSRNIFAHKYITAIMEIIEGDRVRLEEGIQRKITAPAFEIIKIFRTKKNFVKWSYYSVKIDESLLNNIKKFVQIDGDNKNNAKLYRLTKKDNSTGVFTVCQNAQLQNNEINAPIE
jgi:hypothetical protein